MNANRAQRRGANGQGVAASNGGYRLPKRTMRVVFEGTDYDGAEAVLNMNVKLGFYFDAVEAQESGDAKAILNFLADTIVSWNLEDDDGPIPPTLDGFRRVEDLGFIYELMGQWEKAMVGAVTAGPLSAGLSSSTDTSDSPS